MASEERPDGFFVAIIASKMNGFIDKRRDVSETGPAPSEMLSVR